MRALGVILSGWLLLGLAGVSAADNKPKPPAKDAEKEDKKAKIDKEKLIGAWEVTEDAVGEKGTVFEFAKKDKITLSAKKKKAGLDGTYKLDGDKLTWSVGMAGVKVDSPPMKVTKLNEKELVLEYPNGDKMILKKK
jgi:uncharacterized protein (TIGR03066 family)